MNTSLHVTGKQPKQFAARRIYLGGKESNAMFDTLSGWRTGKLNDNLPHGRKVEYDVTSSSERPRGASVKRNPG